MSVPDVEHASRPRIGYIALALPLAERELIARIRRAQGRLRTPAVVRGIGDDCAVLRLPSNHEALITTDFTLENVHFRRAWHPSEAVGHRCLTRGLSDIAAMGGQPIAAFLSLALPPDLEQAWVDGFLRGFTALARKFKVQLTGGDTAQSPIASATGGILADVIVLGSVPRGKAVLRSGAKIGDDIFVTGALGGSTAVLHQLMRSDPEAPAGKAARRGRSSTSQMSPQHSELPAAVQRSHFYPTPRLAVGSWLRGRGLISAMIDVSDGLSTDLSHICEESGVGAWIAEKAVPVAPGATLDEALNGGDDYELLFTAPAAKHDRIPDRIAGVTIRWLGTITKKSGMWLVAPDMKSRRELMPRGWEHFR